MLTIYLRVAGISVSMNPMKSLFLVAVVIAGAFCGSCNTMVGVGRDLRLGGEGLETSANRAKGGGGGGGDTSGAPVY